MIKELLNAVFLGKYLGSVVRTLLAAFGGYLVSKNIATPADAEGLTTAIEQIILSPEFGGVLIGTAQGASLLEKKLRK